MTGPAKTFGKRKTTLNASPGASPSRKSTMIVGLATLGAVGLAGAVYANRPSGAAQQPHPGQMAQPAQTCAKDQNGAEKCAQPGGRSSFFFWAGRSAPPQAASPQPAAQAARPAAAPASGLRGTTPPAQFGGFGASAAAHGAAHSGGG